MCVRLLKLWRSLLERKASLTYMYPSSENSDAWSEALLILQFIKGWLTEESFVPIDDIQI